MGVHARLLCLLCAIAEQQMKQNGVDARVVAF